MPILEEEEEENEVETTQESPMITHNNNRIIHIFDKQLPPLQTRVINYIIHVLLLIIITTFDFTFYSFIYINASKAGREFFLIFLIFFFALTFLSIFAFIFKSRVGLSLVLLFFLSFLFYFILYI